VLYVRSSYSPTTLFCNQGLVGGVTGYASRR